jgi:D-inositol-3-phosphate glycosyltransferase
VPPAKDDRRESLPGTSAASPATVGPVTRVSLLTGGSDRPYVFGMTMSLLSRAVVLDLIGSDELAFPEFRDRQNLTFRNLRGSSAENVSFGKKARRIARYYLRLIIYALNSRPKLFHILWNNKFELFDRTALMVLYRLLGKKVVLTVHNVNADKRDGIDTFLNRLTLRIQYSLANHIFVHTRKMKEDLLHDFHQSAGRVTIIPFGINNAVPNTALTPAEAKQQLGLRQDERILLFFGRITPYKGLEYLVTALKHLVNDGGNYRLIVAGRPDRCEQYWSALQETMVQEVGSGRVILKAGFIPDEETEVYFKAADAVILPYRQIYQSGVLFLGQSFGLPVLAADVGSLKEDIVDGETGFTFQPEDPADLVAAIERYFSSSLYRELNSRRERIKQGAEDRHSWATVAQIITEVYSLLLNCPSVAVPQALRSA